MLRHLGVTDVDRRAAVVAHLDFEGLQLLQEKDFEGAIDSFSEAIELDPLQSVLYVHRAVSWTALGSVEKALRDTEAALETGARSGDLFVLRSKLFGALGNVEKSDAEMQLAAAIAPVHPEVALFQVSQL